MQRDFKKLVEGIVRNWCARLDDPEQSEVECLLALWQRGETSPEVAIRRTLIAETWKTRRCRVETWRAGQMPERPLYLEDLLPSGEDDSRWNLIVDGPEKSVIIDVSLDEFERFLKRRDKCGPKLAEVFRLWRNGEENNQIGERVGRSQQAIAHCLRDTIFPALRSFWGET